MNEMRRERIPLNEIRNDDTFRISKPAVSDALLQSVRELGMLEKPHLLDCGEGLIPVNCHNRILALRALNMDSVDSCIIRKIDPDFFSGNAALKVRRGEVGPVGKCRALVIAREYDITGDPAHFCRSILNTSPDILNEEFARGILALPEALKIYLDIKDAGFKLIKDLTALPGYMVDWIDGCLGIMQVRVNVFKTVVDHLFDLARKNGRVKLPDFNIDSADDKHLLDAVSRLRFPEYSRLRDRAEELIKAVSARGVSVEFPEFFESGNFKINVAVGARDSVHDIESKLARIDIKMLIELASLLK